LGKADSRKTLRKLAMIDEGFAEDHARLGLDPATETILDPKAAALQVQEQERTT
jgi:hypothetical protein